MSYVETQSKFHVALDGVGLLLQGAPGAPGYSMKSAPVYGNRFASGDRSYNDLSQWWYQIQTDWSGGFKENVSFADDAQFYYSSNIDARTRPGRIRLDRQITQVLSNLANSDEVLDVRNYSWGNGHSETLILADELRDLSGNNMSDSSLGRVDFAIPFKKNLFAFDGSTVSGGLHYTAETTSAPYAFTSVSANINSVIDGSVAGCTVGVNVGDATLFVFGVSTTGNFFCVKTTSATGATFTLVFEFSVDSLGGSIFGAEQLGSDEIVFLTEGDGYWHIYSLAISTGVVTTIENIDTGDQAGIYGAGARYVTKFQGGLLITFLSDGDGEGAIYFYNGSTLTKIFQTDRIKADFSTPEATAILRGGAVIFDGCAFWGNLCYDGESFFNFIKTLDDDPAFTLIPIGTDGEVLYFADNETVSGDDQIIVYSYNKNGSTYKDGANHEAFIVMSLLDKLQSIDKLLNKFTIGFDKLVSGQEINVYYSTNPVPDPNITTGSWSLLGSATFTLDGGTVTSKDLLFPVATVAKKIWIRIELVSGGSNTPSTTDYTIEYLPLPDYRKQWALNINCADEVKRLDGGLVETTARELKSRLERLWWTKSALDFQDLDYATTLVNDVSFDATETTITVDSTADFPEQGRLRVDDEEILYTGKTPSTFTGCTRGARGTRAATHADNSVINNAYKVLVLAVQEQAPILLEDKNLEYIVGLTLREV